MITGFFYNNGSARKQIKKVFILFLSANGIYLIWKSALAFMHGELTDWFLNVFSVKNICKFILLNENKIQSHLWYLGAILYVLLIVTALSHLCKGRWNNILWIITPFLLIGDLSLGKYSLVLFNRQIPHVIVRNWLFVGIPYFSIGLWMQEHRIKNSVQPSKKILIIAIIFFCLSTLLERKLLVSINLNAARDHYISTTPLAISVFLIFLNYVNNRDNIISRVGFNDSTWIYILHPIFITVIGSIMNKLGLSNIYICVRPIIVFVVTTVTIEVVLSIYRKIG